jgi:APA family basic amino acid/polyamine antiporter
MAGILWTYDGWSDAGAIAGEIRNPQRTLPRIFLIGTAAITLLYLAVNAAYIWMIPLAEQAQIAAQPGAKTLAPVVMQKLMGNGGKIAVTVLILISTLGSSHASVMTGARVTFQQARDGLLFGFLGRVSPSFQTPAISLWVQCLLSCVAVLLLETFGKLADTFVFTMWIFYGLAGATLFIFRWKRPAAERPFKCIGYPLVPGLFVLVAGAMTFYSIWQKPAATLPWVGLLLAGVPVYYIWNAFAGSKNNATRI